MKRVVVVPFPTEAEVVALMGGSHVGWYYAEEGRLMCNKCLVAPAPLIHMTGTFCLPCFKGDHPALERRCTLGEHTYAELIAEVKSREARAVRTANQRLSALLNDATAKYVDIAGAQCKVSSRGIEMTTSGHFRDGYIFSYGMFGMGVFYQQPECSLESALRTLRSAANHSPTDSQIILLMESWARIELIRKEEYTDRLKK